MDGILSILASAGTGLGSALDATAGVVAAYPEPALALIAGLGGLLVFLHLRGRARARDLARALEAEANSIPCRTWPHLGRVDAAALLTEALRVFGRRLDAEGAATHYGALGLLYLQRGDGPRAEKMLEKAVELFEIANVREGVAVYGRFLSLLYRERGDMPRARETAERSLAMYRALAIDPDAGEAPPQLSLKGVVSKPPQ